MTQSDEERPRDERGDGEPPVKPSSPPDQSNADQTSTAQARPDQASAAPTAEVDTAQASTAQAGTDPAGDERPTDQEPAEENPVQERPAAGPPWPAPGPDIAWWRSGATGAPAQTDAASAADADGAGPDQARRPGPYSRPPRTLAAGAGELPNPPGIDPLRTARLEFQPPPARVTPPPALPPPIELVPVSPAPFEEAATAVPARVPPQRLPPRTPPPPARGSRAPRPRRDPRQPWLALPALLMLAMLAAFLSWVSAEPFWLAVGHGSTGTATVVAGEHPCRATFVAAGGAFQVSTVDVAGIGTCTAGVAVPARMVSAEGERAYATDAKGLNLRWGIGFGLVLVCGVLIAWLTGATRFTGWRRAVACGLSLAGPLGLAAAMLALSF